MPEYIPRHPIFKHPQPMFFPQGERPSFTSVNKNTQNYSSVNFNLCMFGLANQKTKDSALNDSKNSL